MSVIADTSAIGLYVGWFFAVVCLLLLVGGGLLIRASGKARDDFSAGDRFMAGSIMAGCGVLGAVISHSPRCGR